MSVINPPGFLQASSYSAADLRRNAVTIAMQRSLNVPTHLGAQGGYLPGRFATWSISGFNLTVTPFAGIVENGFGTDQGDYPVYNTANQLLTFAGSSPTQGRIDLVGTQIEDAFYSGTNNDGNLVIIQGTPSSGTPVAPAAPATFLPLLQASIPAGSSTPTITDQRKIVPAAGGIAALINSQSADAGAFTGAYRNVDTAGSGNLPRNVLAGYGSDGAWHAANGWRMPRPTPTFGNTAAASIAVGVVQTIASVTIPDPGVPYWVVASASLLVHKSATDLNIMAFSTTGLITIDTTSQPAAGSVQLIGANWFSNIKSDGTLASLNVPARPANILLTGSHTINFLVAAGGNGVAIVGPLNSDLSWAFDVWIIPG